MKPLMKMPKSVTNQASQNGFLPNDIFTFTDDFTACNLNYRWIGIRGPCKEFISLSKKGRAIKPFETNIKANVPTSPFSAAAAQHL